MLRSVYYAARRHLAEDIFLMLVRRPEQHRQKTPPVEHLRDRPARRFYVGGQDVEIFDHRVADGAGLDPAGPAGDERRLEPTVVTCPLGKGEARALLADDYHQSILGKAMLIQQVDDLPHLPVVIRDLRQIPGHVLSRLFGIHEVRRQFEFGRIVSRGIAFVPWRMRLIRAREKTERSIAALALAHQFVDGLEIRIILLARVLERENLSRTDVLLAAERHAVAERL
jgi:hypothetical protein